MVPVPVPAVIVVVVAALAVLEEEVLDEVAEASEQAESAPTLEAGIDGTTAVVLDLDLKDVAFHVGLGVHWSRWH